MKPRYLIAFVASLWIAVPAAALEVTRESVPGITNLSRLETVVTCAGAIQATAVPEIKKMGYVSIINLREGSETGANVEEHEAAAKAAGLRYFHIPFNAASPEPAAVDRFIDVISSEGVEPAFIHCFRGSRAATMWFIKRLVVDHWDTDRAEKEAAALGMSNPALRAFAMTYAQTHKRK
jgi:uncharacterized protein (TIGR01244 family)